MESNIHDISKYPFDKNDKLLIDASVWILAYGPTDDPKDERRACYTLALKSILENKSAIYTNLIVLSEFVNRYARLEYERSVLKSSHAFKEFRKSSEFARIAKDISDGCRRILKDAKRGSDDEGMKAIDRVINEFASGRHDFNDQLLAAICSTELKFVTDDADAIQYNIQIVTGNKSVLN